MEEKKIIILDLTDCKYLGELHERIRVAFGFPEWYGANMSAFDDLLWTECDAEELIIIGENTLPKEFERILAQIHRILDKKVKQTQEDHMLYNDIKPFSYRIESWITVWFPLHRHKKASAIAGALFLFNPKDWYVISR